MNTRTAENQRLGAAWGARLGAAWGARLGATAVTQRLKACLAKRANEHVVVDLRIGARYCAVMLDDGGCAVASVCPEHCGESRSAPTRPAWSPGLPASEGLCASEGLPASDLLASLGSENPVESALGLAAANALANRTNYLHIGGDILDVLDLRPDDCLGMVGYFGPLVEPLRLKVGRLEIFERGGRTGDGLLPEEKIPEILPRCSVALITATTIINGTIEAVLRAARGCREVVVLGPSTPLVPEAFPSHVTLLSGMVATDPEGLLHTVAADGGTRQFLPYMKKANLRLGYSNQG